jgi:HemY protein
MLKHLLTFLLIIILSISLGVWFKTDPGYVLIIFHHWQIQTSLVVTLLMLAFGLLIAKFSLKILQACFHIPGLIKNSFLGLIQRRHEKQVHQGLEAFFQDKWQDTIKKIQPLQDKSSWNIDLLAAKAAQNQGSIGLRDQFIHSALNQSPQSKDSILLYQAKLQIAEQQFEQAQATLNSISQHFQKQSTQWLALQLQLDFHFKHYEEGLRRLKPLHETQQEQYQRFLSALLSEKIQASEIEAATHVFEKSPKSMQQAPKILAIVAPHFAAFPKTQRKVFKNIKKCLQEKLDGDLLKILPKLSHQNHWIDLLNQLSQQNPGHAELLCTMGVMKAKQKLWGSAMIDLQQSIELKPTTLAYSALAQVYLDLDQSSNALQSMQKALEVTD